MLSLYNLFVHTAGFILKLAAPYHSKINLWINGRKNTFRQLTDAIRQNDAVIWFHCASLGEFEQGRPLMEEIRVQYPNHKIVLSFFSPSGYEVQKHYKSVDAVVYLPIDTRANCKKFIDKIHPGLAVFIKYEFWPNLLNELKKRNISTLLVSGIFRKNQLFFKNYGLLMRRSLATFSYFFVQDNNSKKLLNSIGFNNATVSGDTRFDRVHKIAQQKNILHDIERFKDGHYTLVAGSVWDKDEDILVHYINREATDKEKFIIVPHQIKDSKIKKLKESIHKKTAVYTQGNFENCQVIIVNTVGMLTDIYRYADTAYVGGGFGEEGVHNVLEPAVFGAPVVIGPVFHQFKEAVELVERKGCLVIQTQKELNDVLKKLYQNKSFNTTTGKIAHDYVLSHIGATTEIMKWILLNCPPALS